MENKQLTIKLPIIIKKNKITTPKIYPKSDFVLYFDGCSKGNPGHSGCGSVIYKNGIEIWSEYKYIGNNKTNNEAEYTGLILGLEAAINQDIKNLCVCGDSLLVINQVNGVYKVKSENLVEFYNRVNILKKYFKYIDFNHVYRNENKRADQLSNLALLCIDSDIKNNNINNNLLELSDLDD